MPGEAEEMEERLTGDKAELELPRDEDEVSAEEVLAPRVSDRRPLCLRCCFCNLLASEVLAGAELSDIDKLSGLFANEGVDVSEGVVMLVEAGELGAP